MRASLGQHLSCLSILLTIVGLICLPAASAEAQTIVTPSDLQGWLIGPFGTPPFADFVEGPGTPPTGTGSYATEITEPASKIILARIDYHDLPLSDLTAFSFWTYIDPAATNLNNWYINLYVDADGDGSWDSRLDYIPPSADVIAGIWQPWDAYLGVWSSSSGPTTLADFLVANPNARINAFDDPLGGAIRFNMGDTASSYIGFIGNLDTIRIAVDGVGDTTWDMELQLPSPVIGVPTLSTWGLAGMMMLLILAGALMLRQRS